jgi:hypothetical protein
MSKADVNALTIMSIVANCAINIISDAITEELSIAMLNLTQEKINSWPLSGDYKKLKSRAMSHCKIIEYELKSSELFCSDPCCTARLAQYLLIELRDCTANYWKLSAIDEILEYVNSIIDLIDPQEENGAAMNEADRLVLFIKKQIGAD